MSRKPQPQAPGGTSKRLIQDFINRSPEILSQEIRRQFGTADSDPIEWLSPLENDEYAEYSDKDVLQRLGITLPGVPLGEFWPKGGPSWDALGKSRSGQIYLVEAKARVNELKGSALRATNQEAREKIEWALARTRQFLESRSKLNWTAEFYQYANRLAHLYLLRELNGLDAFLVWVYFTNDAMINGPSSRGEWESAIMMIKQLLGIRQPHKLSAFIADVFIDV
jgi:hypothetical protein